MCRVVLHADFHAHLVIQSPVVLRPVRCGVVRRRGRARRRSYKGHRRYFPQDASLPTTARPTAPPRRAHLSRLAVLSVGRSRGSMSTALLLGRTGLPRLKVPDVGYLNFDAWSVKCEKSQAKSRGKRNPSTLPKNTGKMRPPVAPASAKRKQETPPQTTKTCVDSQLTRRRLDKNCHKLRKHT